MQNGGIRCIPVIRFTTALVMPSTLLSAFSILATHDAHVSPPMRKMAVFVRSAGTLISTATSMVNKHVARKHVKNVVKYCTIDL